MSQYEIIAMYGGVLGGYVVECYIRFLASFKLSADMYECRQKTASARILQPTQRILLPSKKLGATVADVGMLLSRLVNFELTCT